MELEEWELLPKDDPSKSTEGKSPGGVVEEPSRILLESIEDVSKIGDRGEKVVMEVVTEGETEPPTSEGKDDQGGGFGDGENAKSAAVEERLRCSDAKKAKGLWDGIGFAATGWRFSGMGALCTIGVAAAAICIFLLGTRGRQKHHHQKIHFQIYSDDKNLKQMVEQATRLNNAISATRGVPMTRANITFGGHYAGA